LIKQRKLAFIPYLKADPMMERLFLCHQYSAFITPAKKKIDGLSCHKLTVDLVAGNWRNSEAGMMKNR
jgi:hypothetical protein